MSALDDLGDAAAALRSAVAAMLEPLVERIDDLIARLFRPGD